MNILSVDDSKAVHSYLKVCFAGTPHSLEHAYSGEEALEFLLGEKKEQFDLVLLDWEMPGLTGPDVLEKARQAGVTCPIIMLTSRNKPEDIISIMEKGATEYVMKPFTKDLLDEKISTVTESLL